jgi:murein DD-endopeptidase MepM/ murein hydrolase activator NlpD
MVEIDHGNGVATRYAHLSGVAVRTGATVEAGDVVGRVGSTGRSTGPHLHYEVRLLGDITDPQRFLRAGLRLAGSD